MHKLKITVAALITIAIAGLVGFVCYGPPKVVWQRMPIARGYRYQEILNDKSLIGLSRSSIQEKLGLPDQVEGPYSWWSLLDKPTDGELSALAFHYERDLSIARVELRENTSKENVAASLPLQLDEYHGMAAESRHSIHLAVADLSKRGSLPEELATMEDVERFFPKARFVENWYYYAGLAAGSVVVGFNSDGEVQEVWNDW